MSNSERVGFELTDIFVAKGVVTLHGMVHMPDCTISVQQTLDVDKARKWGNGILNSAGNALAQQRDAIVAEQTAASAAVDVAAARLDAVSKRLRDFDRAYQ